MVERALYDCRPRFDAHLGWRHRPHHRVRVGQLLPRGREREGQQITGGDGIRIKRDFCFFGNPTGFKRIPIDLQVGPRCTLHLYKNLGD